MHSILRCSSNSISFRILIHLRIYGFWAISKSNAYDFRWSCLLRWLFDLPRVREFSKILTRMDILEIAVWWKFAWWPMIKPKIKINNANKLLWRCKTVTFMSTSWKISLEILDLVVRVLREPGFYDRRFYSDIIKSSIWSVLSRVLVLNTWYFGAGMSGHVYPMFLPVEVHV